MQQSSFAIFSPWVRTGMGWDAYLHHIHILGVGAWGSFCRSTRCPHTFVRVWFGAAPPRIVACAVPPSALYAISIPFHPSTGGMLGVRRIGNGCSPATGIYPPHPRPAVGTGMGGGGGLRGREGGRCPYCFTVTAPVTVTATVCGCLRRLSFPTQMRAAARHFHPDLLLGLGCISPRCGGMWGGRYHSTCHPWARWGG